MKFPHPYNEVLVLFLDVPGEEIHTPSFTWTNVEQIKAAQFIYNLKRQKIAGKFVVLCNYSSTVKDLKNLDEWIPIFTVDSFMGKEADIVRSLTTRSTTVLNEEIGQFLINDQRLTDALICAREGMVILGSRIVLERSQLWRKLL
ncbi:unnamed protein product [Enterobius vermicularis]|uniref:AAA_12 domain-containing protein n=1 Tax=Enterobius vermicularis TaxID=51028 RepID=A0A0N4VKW1_ENTVE|nr:unnamed protein product [Enterobius vermicularis]